MRLALVVHPSIKSADELKGKSVAITGFSGLPYTGLLLCLKELGMTREQVVPLNIGGKAARFEALLGNKVPAAILDPPYTTLAAKEGYKLLVDLAPLDVPFMRNVVAVSEKSMRILGKYLRLPLDKNRFMIEEGYETYREMMLRKPYADPAAMQIVLDSIAESNPKARGINLTSFIDSSFVERLDRAGAFNK